MGFIENPAPKRFGWQAYWTENRSVTLPGSGPLRAAIYDSNGREVSADRATNGRIRVVPGGFTIVTRGL